MKENGFTLKKARSKQYSAQTIMDVDYTDDIALLANTSTQAESLLHSLEQAAGGIGLLGNANKTEYTCFNQKGDISTLNGGSLKLVDKFINFGSSVSFTENDINMRLLKACTAIDRLLIIWKSNLSDWLNRLGLQNTLTASLQIGKTPLTNVLHMTLNNLIVRLQ